MSENERLYENFLDSDRHKKVKIGIGGGRRIGIICLCLSLMISAFTLGGVVLNTSEATTGSLISKNGVWYGDASDDGAEIEVGWSGWYKIEVCGGGSHGAASAYNTVTTYGGKLSAAVYLSEGDKIKVLVLAGGNPGSNNDKVVPLSGTPGGQAIMVYINEIPLVGAGGAGGSYYERESRKYQNSGYGQENTSKIDNTYFSSGAGGGYYGSSASEGNTIEGCVPAPICYTYYGTAGQNYLDTSRATLIEMPNGSTSVSFRVEAQATQEEDTYEAQVSQANSLQKIAVSVGKIAEKSGSNVVTPVITVIAGKDFDLYVNGNGSTGSADGIQIINNDPTDNYINVVGRIDRVGTKEIVIEGTKYVFQVVSEPNSSNVAIVLE